tara:strand:- start:695 stop:1078 length:384 start_codon:yes stop_codon:yes gene_type:complete
MWASPLKQPKVKKEEVEAIKHVKCRVPKGSAKSIAGAKTMDEVGARWVERWIEQFVQENSYPPQLVSGDFVALLGKWLDPHKAMEALERLRSEYKRSFAWSAPAEEDDDFTFLLRAIAGDPIAQQVI